MNGERYIEQTIQSVLAQKECELEYIILDGMSSDGTMDIVNKYRDQIDIVISEKDAGIYNAYNKGIHIASGDVIYFLNSDDYFIHNLVLKDISDMFDTNSELAAVYGNVLKINELTGYSVVFGHEVTEERLKRGTNIPHQGLFVKKQYLTNYHGFDEQYSILADLDFVTRFFGNPQLQTLYMPYTIAAFRMDGVSSSLNSKFKMREQQVAIVEKYFNNPYQLQPYDITDLNREYYKKWIEFLLFSESSSISAVLVQRNIRRVAIFATVELAVMIQRDLELAGISVQAFMDNNPATHNSVIRGVTVYSPAWLSENGAIVDAIVFAFEGTHDQDIKAQIAEIVPERNIPCISWRELIALNLS